MKEDEIRGISIQQLAKGLRIAIEEEYKEKLEKLKEFLDDKIINEIFGDLKA